MSTTQTTKATRNGNRKQAIARERAPGAVRPEVRAEVLAWLAAARLQAATLYDSASAIAHEIQDNPEGEIATLLGADDETRRHFADIVNGIEWAESALTLLRPRLPETELPSPVSVAHR